MPKTPAPQFRTLTKLEKGTIGLAEVLPLKEGVPLEAQIHSMHMQTGVAGLEFCDAAGKKLSLEEFQKKAKIGSIVLVTFTRDAVDPAYLNVLKSDTLIVVGLGQPIVTNTKVPPVKKN